MLKKQIDIKQAPARSNVKPSLEEIESAFWKAADKISGPAFTREQLAEFAGISPRRLANMDCDGSGPSGGFFSGRRKLYLKKQAIMWLLSRVEA